MNESTTQRADEKPATPVRARPWLPKCQQCGRSLLAFGIVNGRVLCARCVARLDEEDRLCEC